MAESTPTTVWMVKPPSKTALFTAEYPILATPNIYLLQVSVTSAPGRYDKIREHVRSHSLRRSVIEDWVQRYLKEYIIGYGIKLWATTPNHGAPLDHVLLLLPPAMDTSNEAPLAIRINDLWDHPYHTVDDTKDIRNASGEIEEHIIRVAPRGAELVKPGKGVEYWHMLGVILQRQVASMVTAGTRNRSGEILFEAVQRPSAMPIASSINPGTTTTALQLFNSLRSMTPGPTKPYSEEISVLVRAKGRLEAKGANSSYKFDFDLVPGIREEKNLADFVRGIFGSATDLDSIRKTLVGLEVIKDYTVPGSQSALATRSTVVPESEDGLDPQKLRTTPYDDALDPDDRPYIPVFTIRDVKRPDDDDTKLSQENGQAKLSVEEYFKTSKSFSFLQQISLVCKLTIYHRSPERRRSEVC